MNQLTTHEKHINQIQEKYLSKYRKSTPVWMKKRKCQINTQNILLENHHQFELQESLQIMSQLNEKNQAEEQNHKIELLLEIQYLEEDQALQEWQVTL